MRGPFLGKAIISESALRRNHRSVYLNARDRPRMDGESNSPITDNNLHRGRCD